MVQLGLKIHALCQVLILNTSKNGVERLAPKLCDLTSRIDVVSDVNTGEKDTMQVS